MKRLYHLPRRLDRDGSVWGCCHCQMTAGTEETMRTQECPALLRVALDEAMKHRGQLLRLRARHRQIITDLEAKRRAGNA